LKANKLPIRKVERFGSKRIENGRNFMPKQINNANKAALLSVFGIFGMIVLGCSSFRRSTINSNKGERYYQFLQMMYIFKHHQMYLSNK